jgi:hypothetical protein
MADSESATKSVAPKSSFSAMGFEKEMKQPHGPKVRGKHPLVVSHTAKPDRKITVGKKAT